MTRINVNKICSFSTVNASSSAFPSANASPKLISQLPRRKPDYSYSCHAPIVSLASADLAHHLKASTVADLKSIDGEKKRKSTSLSWAWSRLIRRVPLKQHLNSF
ncbi:hypothetical protein Tdes44962_MAKER08257 [Teratosphaeria destructans]|uniref:Uncharacterized protein n=1 Tax=Teratosphaeria destructans TaxID=418781 RepID=A0A9W7SX47_9PEZI|nr:hypothetical protein Tdes44962_MAKER08257 [Teratosphaeria destructans]